MEIYIILGFGIVLAIIIALIFIKDSETNKKFTRYERAIESAIQENYNLKKQLAALASFKPDDDEQLKDVKDELKEQINEQINEKIVQKDRMFNLEERTRDINKIAPSVINEEEQILKMFKDGKSAAMIAKDLHVGMGRVEFVLKFHKLA